MLLPLLLHGLIDLLLDELLEAIEALLGIAELLCARISVLDGVQVQIVLLLQLLLEISDLCTSLDQLLPESSCVGSPASAARTAATLTCRPITFASLHLFEIRIKSL